MSISKPRMENPAKKFIGFSGKNGQFTYYDKSGEKETWRNVEIQKPIYLIVLDELSAIKGYCKKTESGITSNEVHNITTDVLKVRTFKGGLEAVGKYKDISDKVKIWGGKFTKSVYALLITGKTQAELVNFQFKGASLNSWIDKKFNTEKFGVIIKNELQEGKNGDTIYKIPVFGSLNITPELFDIAIKTDNEILQPYLRSYTATQMEKEIIPAGIIENEIYPDFEPETTTETIINQVDDGGDLPF